MDKKVEVIVAGDDKPGIIAILSLIFGILSILNQCVPIVGAFLGFILSIAAIVLGILEFSRIKKGIACEKGRGMSIAGIILGTFGILIGIFWIIALSIMWIAGAFGGLPDTFW